MTDQKATIKVEFSMYGSTEKVDMHINYDVSSHESADVRVLDWFELAYERLRAKRLLAETDSDE